MLTASLISVGATFGTGMSRPHQIATEMRMIVEAVGWNFGIAVSVQVHQPPP